ncbi:Hsp70 family protein [Cellulophaga omnivescoria]|uniref:Hsp70 family protein n=1 Tax=Cellulophaga omnivescoria TaxID=1888890 RepID=UPI0022F1132C|nr:Hsp70 family protein [Cellulophaga omnivescoria]WBU88306.1 Hsp70 family protein [Cellulophaga omnivescoria]
MKTINFGIDLGTTNSLIAKYENGLLEVFKNPIGQKQTLASAVAFRGSRILVGDKARDLLEKDPLNVFTCFKRKMGTTDRYFAKSINKDVSPIELSAYVLKELKNFIHTGEELHEAVITIPSSFDTIQSNATKTAGQEAGFKKVYLLQEPIAASLAFANKNNLELNETKKWLIYDFGGGTFDVALLEINEREMNVLDNEGDNFLGGMDIDNLIIEKLLVPKLEPILNETKLWDKFKEPNNPLQKLYFELLFRAEEAKKELSRFETTEIDIDYPEKDIYTSIEVTRDGFNNLLAPLVEHTINFCKKILNNNNLISTDIEKIIMVGGSTLIPYVREQVEKNLNIIIDTSVDPTAAVGIGAAYYAGSKISALKPEDIKPPTTNQTEVSTSTQPLVNLIFEKNTKDTEELLAFKLNSSLQGFYRVIRKDGGFDTGLVTLQDNVNVFVDLLEGQVNSFSLKIYNSNQDVVYTNNDIHINQGKYNIQGQLLPNDICLEIDDIQYNVTRLEAIFNKNSVLPLKKTIYKSASKTILKDSDDKLQINIVEGDGNGLPSSGLSIGYIEITGKELEQDLIKGTDIELNISVSESRDIDVDIFLTSCDQEFSNSFKPTERYISNSKMENEIRVVTQKIEREIAKPENAENYELLQKFKNIEHALIELQIELSLLVDNDITDAKFKIDNQKRSLIQKYDLLTRHKELDNDIEEYKNNVLAVKQVLAESGSEYYMAELNKVIANEKTFINSGNKYLIRSKIEELRVIRNAIFTADDSNFIGPFFHYKTLDNYPDQQKANILIAEGDKALENKQYKVVKQVVYQLASMLPDDKPKTSFNNQDKTGLS